MYQILFENKSVGCAQIQKEGMYYRVHCSCALPDNGIYRIIAEDGCNITDLGICVPEGHQFALSARVACKNLKLDNLSFQLVCNTRRRRSVPVAVDTELAYLDKLETARLQITNGRAEILID